MSVAELFLGVRKASPAEREASIPGLRFLASGKVRDIYEVDAQHLLFVTSDRISAFDVIMDEGIPYKGAVLTQVAAWWFERSRELVPNHLVSSDVDDVPGLSAAMRDDLRGRVLLVQRCEPSDVEWVVRGYLAGSGHKLYRETGSVCGVTLPAGLELASKLPEPILTPTTKDDDHDLPINADEARRRAGEPFFEYARSAALELFGFGSRVLAEHGVLLADTKFEFGLRDGKPILIDEALTPDSSRFWPAADWTPGRNQTSWDKQILRDWLETLDWNKEYPPPTLDPEIMRRTSARYLEFCAMLTGSPVAGAPGG